MKKFAKIFLPLILSLFCFGLSACGETPETPAELPAPEALQITNDVLYWNAAEGAEDYGVYIDGVEHITAECSYDLSREDSSCVHKIEVVAYGKNGAACSRGETIEYVGRNAPPTEGLEFSMQASANRCSVTKVSVDESGVCILPETYNGARVVGFKVSMNAPMEGASQVKVLYLSRNIDKHTLRSGFDFHKFTALERIYTAERDDQFIAAGGGIIDSSENKLIVAGMKTVIPDYVTQIGEYAYGGRALKSFVVPERISVLGDNLFADCEQLKSVTLPAKADFGSGLFARCEQLESVTLPAQVTEGTNWGGLFMRCSSLKEAIIPNGVVRLGSTFERCTSIAKANIPDGVEELVFAFSYCTSLTEVNLPESMREITGAFQGCTALKEIKLPSNVSILDGAFAGCAALESVTVPGSVKSLDGTFALCASLKSVVLEEGVERLRYTSSPSSDLTTEKLFYPFQQCVSLKEIVIPSTMTTIGMKSFTGCNALEAVYYNGTAEEWAEKVKVYEDGNETLLSATRYYYSEAEPTEAGNFWHYVDGKPVKWAE